MMMIKITVCNKIEEAKTELKMIKKNELSDLLLSSFIRIAIKTSYRDHIIIII